MLWLLLLLQTSLVSAFLPLPSSLDGSSSKRESSTRLYGPVMMDSSTSGSRPFRARNPVSADSLAGIVTIKDPASRHICVLCHGLLGGKDQGIVKKLGEELPVNTCRFDFAGNGESEGAFRYAGYERELQDLRAIVEHLRAEGFEVTAILGHSKGAHTVMKYAWTYDDVPKVVSLSGRFDFSNQPKTRFTKAQMDDLEQKGEFVWTVRGKGYTVTKEDYVERGSVDMSRVSQIQKSYVLVLHGDADDTIPVTDASSLAASLSKCSLRILKGASHFFIAPQEVKEVVDVGPVRSQAVKRRLCVFPHAMS